jgi:hypothetical protein
MAAGRFLMWNTYERSWKVRPNWLVFAAICSRPLPELNEYITSCRTESPSGADSFTIGDGNWSFCFLRAFCMAEKKNGVTASSATCPG